MPERYFSAVIIQIYAWKAFQRGIQNTSKICYSKKRKVEEGNMATIKEIAEKLGISTTTVSNVIHGKTGKRLRKRWYVTTMLPITERRKRRHL